MTPPPPEASPSLISELLLYHALLGRGYVSPFSAATKGLVFSSALPFEALSVLASAETSFRKWHDQETEKDRAALALMESTPDVIASVTGTGDKAAMKKLKEKLSRRPHITWKEDQVTKSTLVELLKTHYYGAMTYVDIVGARLAGSLSHTSRLASDLGWVTLTEGTTDETLIRANASGGACIHSLAGSEAIFNHFCSCKVQHIEKLVEKIKETPGGQVGIGTTVILKGYPDRFSGVSSAVLFSLARRVFALGEKPVEQRIRVVFSRDSEVEWAKMLEWALPDLLNDPTPSAWQWKLSLTSPASVKTAVMFGARAAMVAAFLQAAETNLDGRLAVVELDMGHLKLAQAAARKIYELSSGQEGFEKRIRNLKPAHENFVTPQKLQIARVAMTEALKNAPGRRLARTQIRRSAAPGVTLGLLDELVRLGEIIELNGPEECQMGRTTKAYALPQDAPPCSELEAIDEYREAVENFAENPDAFFSSPAFEVVRSLREKADAFNKEHMLPVVPLSRMSKRERKYLPKVLDMLSSAFLLRGAAAEIPEPSRLLMEDDLPLDEGLNLWVRHRPTGEDFCDWDRAKALGLGGLWGSGEAPQT